MNTTPSPKSSGSRKAKTFAKPAFAPVGTPAQVQHAAPAATPAAPVTPAATPAPSAPVVPTAVAAPAAH